MNPLTVLVVGELNPDLVLSGYRAFPVPGKEVLVDDFLSTLGSASAICAVGLARLGARVAFLGKVGTDLWGRACTDALEEEGVDVSRVIRDPSLKTGVTVSITDRQDRALLTYPGSIIALRGSDVSTQAFEGFSHVHISSYFLQRGLRPDVRSVFARARRAGLTTSLDPGFDPAETWNRDLLQTLEEVDLFFPNEIELGAITGEADPFLALQSLQNGRTLTVAKLGAAGCAALDGGRLVRRAAYSVPSVETTGAGDSFNAGFLYGWLERRPLDECLRMAAACGALSTRRPGGTPGQPTLDEVQELIWRSS